MRRARWFGLFLLIASPLQAATLIIRAEGVSTAQNMIYAGICDTSFEEAPCPYKDRGRAKAGAVELRVRNVKPGSYAIAVFHDINGNSKLDRKCRRGCFTLSARDGR